MRGRLVFPVVLFALATPPVGAAEAKKAPADQGPKEAEIRAAYRSKLDWINASSRKFLDEKAAAQVQVNVAKVTLVECNPIADHASNYLCKVLVESSLGNAETETKRVELVMIEDEPGWKLQ